MILHKIYSEIEIFFRRIQMSKDLAGFNPEIYFLLNRLWIIQTLICMFYCMKIKKYLPSITITNNSKHIFISQFNFVLLTYTVLYFTEILYTHLIIFRFNSFIHHTIAIIIFIFTIFNQNIICVSYLIPYLIHSLYWCFQVQYDYLLYIYNISLILVIFLIICFSNLTKKFKFQVTIIALVLFHFNVFTHFYDNDLNHFEKEKLFKLIKSLILSFLAATPFYFYLIYN
ncbi:unnamed protein product [Adineta steineri]|uniref:TLC domain-containing protein n=1 Tax=Adineta steineri TaxID=433720 RepID=A0A815PZV1_9BILA|nr:unnamed protein product [Adineta steineri]